MHDYTLLLSIGPELSLMIRSLRSGLKPTASASVLITVAAPDPVRDAISGSVKPGVSDKNMKNAWEKDKSNIKSSFISELLSMHTTQTAAKSCCKENKP